MHSTLARMAAAALLVATPWLALAGDDAADAVRRAVHDLLHGEVAGRDAARTVLEEHADAAVPELLRVITELRAAAESRAGGEVALSSALPPASSVVPAAREGDMLQVYDVRDLLGGRLTQEALIARLRAVCGEGAAIEAAADGAIVISTPGAGHAAAATLLGDLRSRAVPAYLFESRVLTARPDAALGRDLSGLRTGGVVRVDALQQRLASWEAAGDAHVLIAPTVLSLGDSEASIEIGREISFVADFDVSISAHDRFIADPQVDTVFSGVRLVFRAWPGEGRHRVAIDATVSDVDPDLVVVTSDLGGVVDEPVRFQRPSLVRTTVTRTVTLGSGGSFVMRLADDPDGARRLLAVTLHLQPSVTEDE